VVTNESYVRNQLYYVPLYDRQTDPNQPRKYLDPAVRTQLMDQIIFKWAGCDGVDPASRAVAGTSWIDARQLVALETIMGDGFVHVPDYTPNPFIWAADVLIDAYSMLSSLMYGQLMAQTHLKDYYDQISYAWDETTQTVKGDLTAVAQAIQTQIDNDASAGEQILGEFVRSLRGIQVDEKMNFDNFRDVFASQSDELAQIVDTAGRRAMFGGSGDDTLMDSSAGNDNLNGGYGNDILDSGAGNDTYVLRSGSGQDQISAYDSAAANIDTIQFEDVASTALRAMKRAGNDLILEYGESDAVKVKNFYEAYIGGCSLARLAA